MKPGERFNQEIWWLLQEIRKEQLSSLEGEKVVFCVLVKSETSKKVDGDILSDDKQRSLLHKLKEWGAINLRQELTELLTEMTNKVNKDIVDDFAFNPDNPKPWLLPQLPKPPTKYVLTIHQPKFDEVYRLYESGSGYQGKGDESDGSVSTHILTDHYKGGPESSTIPDKYKISVKDREIWVNNCLIGKPHAVGSNFEFFEYVRSKPSNTLIKRDKMPNDGDGTNYDGIKGEIKNKGFIKILNGLGFKGEILKAFFHKRSRDTLIYRGDKITKEDLEKAGIRINLFLKELELAHTKNSPE